MNLFATYLRWGHYAMVTCLSDQEGLKLLSALAADEYTYPVCVFNPITRQVTWHPENPFRRLQERDPVLSKFLSDAQQVHWMSSFIYN
jgi:hypothetical protein